MKRLLAGLSAASLALGAPVDAAPPPAPRAGAKPHKPQGPAKPLARAPARPAAPPLPMLPSIARVQVRVGRAQVVVVEDVLLPRGDWRSGALDLYVAFGAPSVPRALDAHLVPIADGALAPEDDEAGEVLSVDRAPRRPSWANALLGRDTMAGVVVRVEAEALARAFAPGGMAALRLRTAIDMPEEDASGALGVLVRLGASRGTPLTLGRIVVSSAPDGPRLGRVEAQLCGPDADEHPLAVSSTPRLVPPPGAPPRIAPVLAVRRATDDLCVRAWLAP